MRVGYARVSTSSGEQLAALENQRHKLEAAGVDRIIQDVQSGRDKDRAGLVELIALIEARKVNELVITRIDRLGRDAADTDTVIAFCAKRQVKITALSGGEIESETPAGFMMSRLMTTMAQVESMMLSLRVNDGIREARQRRRPMRGRPCWGYRAKPDKSALEPDPIEFPRAQRFLGTLERCNWRMNTALDLWDAEGGGEIPLHSCRAVKSWLVNPVLRGAIGYGQKANHKFEEIAWGTHEALISDDLFETITRHLEQNRRMWGHNAHRNPRLLTGLCHCGYCYRTMVYAPGRKFRSILCRQRNCPQLYKSTREEIIRDAINEALSNRSLALASAVATEPQEISDLRTTIEKLEAMNDPDLKQVIASKKQRLHILHKRGNVDPELVQGLSQPDFWKNYSYEELRELYHGLVQQVVVRDKQVVEVKLRY